MKFTTITFLLLYITILPHAFGQTDTWIEDRKPFEIEEGDEKYPLYYLYRGKIYDYKYNEQGNFICDITIHQIARVTNDDALKSINRIYIPIGEATDILDIRSRTIAPDGTIAKAYDLEASAADLNDHAAEILADIASN